MAWPSEKTRAPAGGLLGGSGDGVMVQAFTGFPGPAIELTLYQRHDKGAAWASWLSVSFGTAGKLCEMYQHQFAPIWQLGVAVLAL